MSPLGTEDDLLEHRAIISACLRHRVPFVWHGPGTLLIGAESFGAVIADVTEQGFRVLGVDGFDLDPTVRPRLDLIIDNTAGHPFRDPVSTAKTWGKGVWLDVTLARESQLQTE
jgi:hypothetical protein